MSNSEPTRPIDIERLRAPNGAEHDAWQTDNAWSFGSRDRLLARLNPTASTSPDVERSAAANVDEPPTSTPRRETDVSALKPVRLKRTSFGKRGFSPIYQWEGVVEEVNGGGFRARLTPFENGRADVAQVEYADFDYDDLGDESDRAFVMEGAVFYWTVGKSRNSAGTYTNTSLVRFRRALPPTQYGRSEARQEAEAILADLRGG